MRVMKGLLIFSISFMCFISCASSAKKNVQYVNITDSSEFALLPPGGIEKAMDMAQFLSYEFKGQNYFLNTWVKANENEIDMAFFNELGVSIGELFYRNGEVNFSSSVFPKSAIQFIKPEYIIADFQLCFYNPFLLGKSLKESGLVMQTKDDGRFIFSGKEVIIEIKKTENTVKLVNHLRGYSYTLEGDFHEML